jgi:thioredoxin-like negative regulator of GroEL
MQETERLLQIKEMLEKEPNDDFLNYALAVELEASGNTNEAIKQLQNFVSKKSRILRSLL